MTWRDRPADSAPDSRRTSSAAPMGCPGSQRAYGLRFRSVRPLGPAVKYQALAAGQVDVIDGYSTDGLIARYDLVVLRDDRAVLSAVRGGGARQCESSRAHNPARD